VGALAMAAYTMGVSSSLLNLPRLRLLAELWPPALASLALAAVVWPLDRVLLHADSHGLVEGLALLSIEVLVAAAVYLASLQLLSPTIGTELRAAAASARDRLRRPAADRARRRGRRAYVQS